MVRSLFEHGCVLWSPSSKVIMNNFETFQKRCIKWILNEQFTSYSNTEYISKLQSLDILPLYYKFALTDLITFHKVVHHLIPVSLPQYLTSRSNTRSCDSLTFCIDNSIKNRTMNVFNSSFFPRTISPWNSLPFELRSEVCINKFLSGVKTFFWTKISEQNCYLPYELEPD